MKKRVLLLILLVLAIAGYLTWNFYEKTQAAKEILASGTIETTEIQVGSRVGGRIIAVMANEGDNIKKGDVLIKLDPYQLPAQRNQLQSQLAEAQAHLAELRNGARPQEIAAARAQYQEAQARANLVASGSRSEDIAQAVANRRQAEADLGNAQKNAQRFQALLARHVVSQQEYDAAQATYQSALERVNAAAQREQELRRGNRPQEITAARQQAQAQYQQLQLLQAGSRPEDIAAQEAMVSSIHAQIQQLNVNQKELSVYSPCNCQVSSLNLKPGQLILPNQTVASLTNLNDLWVRVYIPEERFGQVRPGDPAAVNVDAFPQRRFAGKVVQIASRAEFTPRNVQTQETRRIQVFGVKVALDNTSGLLRPGMPADVTFQLTPSQQK